MTLESNLALVVPVYNGSSTIRETMTSIRNQSHFSCLGRILLADDGSSDNSIEIACNVLSGVSTLRVLSGDVNNGQWSNLNRALAYLHLEGFEWTFVLHADDIAKPHWLGTMLEQLQIDDTKVATICSSWDNLLPDGRIIQGEENTFRSTEIIPGHPETVRNTLFRGCWWHISGAAIKLSAYHEIGSFDPQYSYNADYDWLLRALNNGYSVLYVPRTLIVYRQHSTSVSHGAFQRDHDLVQGTQIRHKYRFLLSRSERFQLHAKSAYFALRRVARAVTKRDLRRAGVSLFTFAKLLLWAFK